MLISVVIRTLNEETYLADLLTGIHSQRIPDEWSVEVVVVDSGSTDATLDIAKSHECRLTHISQADFSFGRSLNQGCDFARGEILVFVSGHCLPIDEHWLATLVKPLAEKVCSYSYGRQIGMTPTKFSENRVFLKYYPGSSFLPQEGFFANNANAALPKKIWQDHRFDESLTGLEDMHLAKRLVQSGHKIGYIADAGVHHIHDESWQQVRNRFEREGAALAEIMPESGLSFVDFVECTVRSIAKDSYAAVRQGVLVQHLFSIIMFRTLQYWGSYRGTRFARSVAKMRRKAYFHPDRHLDRASEKNHEDHRLAADEGPQQQSAGQELSNPRGKTAVPLDT